MSKNDPDVQIKQLFLKDCYFSSQADFYIFKEAFQKCLWNILNNSDIKEQRTGLNDFKDIINHCKQALQDFIIQWEENHQEIDK